MAIVRFPDHLGRIDQAEVRHLRPPPERPGTGRVRTRGTRRFSAGSAL